MVTQFTPQCRSMVLGSFPHKDHGSAVETVLKYTPDYPAWPQLPVFPQEGMMQQFITGLPGLTLADDRVRVDVAKPGYDQDQLDFFERLLGGEDFPLDADAAGGIFALIQALKDAKRLPLALKGQVVGPFTQAIGAKDMEGRALFFDLQQREAITGLLAARAAWQVKYFKENFQLPVVIFIDEPGLTGFGSSAFIGIGRDEVVDTLSQVIQAIHQAGGLAGIHVCGNTDWGMVMATGADIVNFDVPGYFDRLLLYGQDLVQFVNRGGTLAWGMVPTADGAAIAKARVADMEASFWGHVQTLVDMGLDKEQLMAQSLITPACGLGTLGMEDALRVMTLLDQLSRGIREG